jgi:DNA-binding SARP family transcriptional activator
VKEPLTQLFTQPDPAFAPTSIPTLIDSGAYEQALVAVWQLGAQVIEGRAGVPIDSLLHWLNLFPVHWQRTSPVRYLRAWLCQEQHRYQLSGLLLDELAAEWLEKLEGDEAAEAAQWLFLIRLGQGVVAESQGWWDQARERFAEVVQYLPPPMQEQVARMAGGMEWREARRLAALDSQGVGPVVAGALAVFGAMRSQPALARLSHILGCYHLRRGEPAMARHWLEGALDLKRGQPGHLSLACTLVNLGACYQQLGLLKEAQSTLDEVLRLGIALEHPALQAAALSHLADVHRDREAYDSARDLYGKALSLQEQERDTGGMARTYLGLSVLYRREGQAGLAADAAAEARLLAVGHGGELAAVEAELQQGIALMLLDNEAASGRLDHLVGRLAALHMPREEALGRWYLGVAAQRSGDSHRAAGMMRAALANASESRNMHTLAMELAVVPSVWADADHLLTPEALAGLVQRAAPRGLLALLAACPEAQQVVQAAGRLPETTALSVWLLGPFRVERAGQAVDLGAARSQKAVHLFKFLVAHRGRAVAREQILDAIWPEAAPDSADRSFEVTLSTLRRLLDAPGGPSVIVRRGRGYLINPDVAVVCDVDRFAQHLERGNWWWRRGQGALAADEWEAAVAAYGGDLLVDDPYEDWATAERERLREQYLDLLLRLGEFALEEGRCGEAADLAHRVMACDPIREEAYRLLMRCHARQGNRAAAVRDLQRCSEILRRELGEEPMPETRDLARRIRIGERP